MTFAHRHSDDSLPAFVPPVKDTLAYLARLQTRPLHVGAAPFEPPVGPGDHVPSALSLCLPVQRACDRVVRHEACALFL